MSLLMMVALTVSGQTPPENDNFATVYLKDGRRVSGHVLSYVPGETMVMVSQRGDTLTYNLDDVARVKRKHLPNLAFTGEFGNYGPRHGYRGALLLGVAPISALGNGSSFSVSTLHGYQFKPWLFVGAGYNLGLCRLKNTASGVNATRYRNTVFGDVRLDLTRSRVNPYVDLRLGRCIEHRAYWGFGLGVRYALREESPLALAFEMAYEGIRLISDPPYSYGHETEHMLFLRAGLEF